jgi:hypothetical protein
MSISSVSFWQQDQNYWAKAAQSSQKQSLNSAVISQMFGSQSTLASGLASIANQTALTRVNNALTAAVQSALQAETGGTAPSSSGSTTGSATTSSSASSSGVTSAPAAPASGTGTAPLATGTSLLTLGILKNGSFTVYDGKNTTTYSSNGHDTVGDLINAINANKFGNANVAAGLNASGQLVITSKDNTDTITIGGMYAPNLGFGGANDTFTPSSPPASAATPSTSTASGTSTASTGSSSSTGTSATAKSAARTNSALALQTGGTAELLLAGNGLAGSLLNMLA